MGNYVIGAGNYVIATPSELGNYMIADTVIAALGRQLPQREVSVSSISLVAQAPEQSWTWNPVTRVRLGTKLLSEGR
jgi:hypothetical protein